jgi:hypothetical protein
VYVTPRGTVKLIDFNPVGGTTAPLLFGDWAALGYDFATATEPDPQHAPAVAQGAAAAAGPGAQPAPQAAAGAEPLAAVAAFPPETEAGVQPSASHDDVADSGAELSSEVQHAATRLIMASLDARSATAGAPGGSSSSLRDGSGHANGSSHHHSSVHSAGNGSSSNGGPLQLPDVEFRIVDEPVVMRSTAQVRADISHLLLRTAVIHQMSV